MNKRDEAVQWKEKQTLMRDAIVRHTRFFLETEPTLDFVNVLLQDFETLLFQKFQEERAIAENEKNDAINTAWILGVKEERERIIGEVEKTIEPSVGGDSFEVEARILRNFGRKQAISIIKSK